MGHLKSAFDVARAPNISKKAVSRGWDSAHQEGYVVVFKMLLA